MKRHGIAFSALGVVLAASAARADPMGGDIATGMANAAIMVLLILAVFSLVIAGLEAAAVSAAFHLDGLRTFWILLFANIASGLIGIIGSTIVMGLATKLAVYYVLAVLAEWPFFWWAVNDGPKRSLDAWKATLLAQTVSYGVLLLPLIAWFDLTTPVGPAIMLFR